jgi:hypothetical protein
MPLYYYSMAAVCNVAGIHADDAHSVYLVCRSFNLLAGLLLSGLIFLRLRNSFRSTRLSAFGISVFAFLLMENSGVSGRPDMLKTFFFLLQVLLLCSGKLRMRFLIPAGLLLSLLSFLCKQDGITAFGIMPLAFLFGREWRAFLIYAVSAAGLLATTLFILDWHFSGNFFPNAIGALHNGLSLSWFMSVFSGFFSRLSLLLGLGLVLSYEFIQERNRQLRVLASAFLLAFFPPLLASLKFGSGPNYFQEAVLLSCFMAGTVSASFSEIRFFRFRESRLILMLAIFLLFAGMSFISCFTGVFLNQESRLQQEYESDKNLSRTWEKDYSGHSFMLLTDRQWEDNLSTLLSGRLINPNRDVSAQVYQAKKANALQALRSYVETNPGLILITRKGQNPVFDGLDFKAYQPGQVYGPYQLWMKPGFR